MEAITDLQLRLLRKFRAFPSQSLPSTEFGRKLVGISSRYGFAVIAGPDNRLISVKTSDLQALQSDDFNELSTFPKRDLDFFNLQAEIFSIEFNSDGRVLAVAANTPNGPFVYVFEGFAFHPTYPQQPFPLASIRLASNNSAKLTAFEWNPCIPEIFATSTTDGLSTIQYTLNNLKSYSIIGNQTLKSVVTCISWSPKGKQLTVGDADGKVHQLKPELAPVRTLDAPSTLAGLGNPPYQCIGICWLSTTEWAVVHSSPTTNYINLSILTAKKNQSPTWDPWSGVIPPLSDPSLPRSVNFLPLFDWQFVLATSPCLTNAVTFGSNGTVWKPWELPEPFVINTPLSANRKDTFIVGSGYDFTATTPVIIERDGTQVPPQPIIYTLTSDGVLLLYHVASLNPSRPSLNKPVEPCDLNATKNGEQPIGFQPRAAAQPLVTPSQSTSSTTSSLFAQATTSLSGTTPSTPNLFSTLSKAPETPTTPTTMQNTVTTQNAAAAEEAERKKKEAEAKAAAEEQERQRQQRIAAEEEQRRRAAAEEEAKRMQQQQHLEANFKANLDGLVSKLNEYAKVVDALRAVKLKLMENVTLNVEFDGHMDPLLKSIGYMSVIGQDISESLTRLRHVSNSIQHSAKESQQFLKKDTKELPIPEWVLELSDDLDELEQREFIVVEKLQQAETKMDKISKLLREGKTKVYQRNQLTPEQQQKLEKDSKTMLIFVRKLWERITALRQQVRAINSAEKLVHAKNAIRSAGGGTTVELNESDLNGLDTSGHATSLLASELIASISLGDDKKASPQQQHQPSKSNILKLFQHLEAASNRPPKVVNVIPIDQFISTQKQSKQKEDLSNSIILKPKIAEAQKALIEQLMKVQSPRSLLITDIPPLQPRQPFSVFGNKPIVPDLNCSTAAPSSQPAAVSTPQQKSIFGSGNISFGTPTSSSATTPPIFGQQPKTSTPKPLFVDSRTLESKNPITFTPQQSTLPFFGSPLASGTSSPLTFNNQKTVVDENAAAVATAKEAEKRKAVLEEEQKKKEALEAEAKKKAAEEEKAKKEAEEKAEQERLKKIAEEQEEEKRKAALAAEAEAKARAEEEEKKKAAEKAEAQKQVAAEEEAQKAASVITPTPAAAATAPISFSFKPAPLAAAASPSNAAATVSPSTEAPINFSFKPASTATTATVVKSESSADIGMEDDGLDSAFAGGFSSFGGSAFGKPAAATPAQSNPFGGGFSSTTAAAPSASTFGGTSSFGATVKNPFAAAGSTSTTGTAFGGNTGFSSFGNKPNAFGGGGAFSQQQTVQTTPQKNNPFDGAAATSSPFGSSSTGFGSGTSAFAQTAKSPFASGTSSATTGTGFSSFGNKPTAFGPQASSTFGGTSAFGGGGSTTTTAFSSNSSPFGGGSAFGGGTSAFAQATKSPFASAAATNSSSSTSAFGGGGSGFSAFGNKAGGFGALAQQATSNSQQQNPSGFGSTSAFGGNSAFGPPRR